MLTSTSRTTLMVQSLSSLFPALGCFVCIPSETPQSKLSIYKIVSWSNCRDY